jgi:hypothetical protein
MHLAIRSFRLSESPASRLLGRAHPLARVLDEQACVDAQVCVLSGLIGGSLLAAATGFRAAVPVAIAAGVVDFVWCCRAVGVHEHKRDLVLELVASGGGSLPLDVVERERRRLLDDRRRRRLAEWLAAVAEARDVAIGKVGTRPLMSVGVVTSCRRELLDVVSLVDGDEPGVAGVALLELVVSHGTSPLYGEDAAALRRELWRIRYLMHG